MSENPTVYVYVARCAENNDEYPSNVLAFTSREKALSFIDRVHTALGNDTEWQRPQPGLDRVEDRVGNWAEVERVRISNPAGLFEDSPEST